MIGNAQFDIREIVRPRGSFMMGVIEMLEHVPGCADTAWVRWSFGEHTYIRVDRLVKVVGRCES